MSSGNIISYAENDCRQTFEEKPLTAADSLVFSQLSYNKFSGFVSDRPEITLTLRELMDRDGLPSLYETTRVPEENRRLLYACADSPRYRDVALGFYRSDFDDAAEKQFAAVTFRLTKRLYYVAFRGTDASIVGWKENLNMAYVSPIPSQAEAVRYLRALAQALPEARFILGGHSKGGNLAEYAATYVPESVQWRIADIYNHDGPGFLEGTLDMKRFSRIKSLVHKTVPESSIIGPMLEQPTEFQVVESSAFLYLQHDPLSWIVEKGDFVYAPHVSGFSLKAQESIRRWLAETDDETRRVFIEALYDAISPAKEKGGAELRRMGLIKRMPLMISNIKTEDPEVRQKVTDTFASLMESIAEEVKLSAAQHTRRFLGRIRNLPEGGEKTQP